MSLLFALDLRSFIAGFLAAVVIALIVYGIGWFGRQMGAPMRPMTVVHTTSRTPWQVSMGCLSANLLLFALCIGVALLIVVLVFDAALAEMWWMVAAAGLAFVLGLLTRAMA
jgi:hypothetical protein